MDAASLLAKMMDKPGERLLKAIVFSVALHLTLIMLIQPAPRSAPAEAALQARLVTLERAAARPSLLPKVETDLTESQIAVAPIHHDSPSMPLPAEEAAASPKPETGAEKPEPDDGAKEPQPREQVVVGPGQASSLPEIPVMLDTRWYTAREVDATPRPVQPIQPQYPEQARIQGIQGYVVLQLRIDQFGVVQDIEVQESNPPGVFDQSSLEAFRQARFHPAQRDGYAVRALVKIRVTFELY